MNKKKKWIIAAIVLVVFCLILGLYNLLNDKAPASDDAAKAPKRPLTLRVLSLRGAISALTASTFAGTMTIN